MATTVAAGSSVDSRSGRLIPTALESVGDPPRWLYGLAELPVSERRPLPPFTETVSAALGSGSHVVEATAYDAVNHTSDSAMVTIVDPTCGNSCSSDQVCDMNTGTCIERDDGGGCCSTGSDNGVGSLVLFVSVALVLLRRRRS